MWYWELSTTCIVYFAFFLKFVGYDDEDDDDDDDDYDNDDGDDDDDDDGALDSVSSLTYSSPRVNMALHLEEEQMQILHPLVFHFPDQWHMSCLSSYKPGDKLCLILLALFRQQNMFKLNCMTVYECGIIIS
jgi:hypothetical protein